jgi:molecular chaperone DnaK (HSP70)
MTTIQSVKRFMGLGMEHMNEEDHRRYRFTSAPEKSRGQDIVRFDLFGKLVTPPQVSALILRSLKERAKPIFRTHQQSSDYGSCLFQ